jgi:dipeptidyl aminopeptidase/acylaminoacyl peptidase
MKKIVFLAILLAACACRAQDGKIIEKSRYELADTTIQRLSRLLPDLETIVNAVDFYTIVYLSDGLKVKGLLAVPKKQGKYPCLIFNRGGNRELGVLNDVAMVRLLGGPASWGYITLASQYRGNAGGEGQEEFGGRDVDDVLNLIPSFATIAGADTTRIGIFGWSRGGMETYLALARTCRFKAGVIASGMADAFTTIRKRPQMANAYEQLAPGYSDNKDSVLRSRSAVYWADRLCATTPLLLLTGSADWRVSPDEQLEMVHKLYEIRHPMRFELFEGGQHSLAEHYEEVNHTIRTFLDAYLRDGKKWPSMEPHGN